MDRYNPIYMSYCNATKRDPTDAKNIIGFMSWVTKQKAGFAKERNITRTHAGTSEIKLTLRQVDEFHKWLIERFLEERQRG